MSLAKVPFDSSNLEVARQHDLAVGLDRHRAGEAVDVAADPAARAEAGVEGAVAVVARDGEGRRQVRRRRSRVDRCVADDDDLAVALDGHGQRFLPPQAAAHVGRDLAVDAEAAVEAAVGVEAREDEVDEGAADHDDLAVGLQRHARAVAAEALERRLAGDAEAGVDAGGQRDRRRPVVVLDRQHRRRLRTQRRTAARLRQGEVHRLVRLDDLVSDDRHGNDPRRRVAIERRRRWRLPGCSRRRRSPCRRWC